MEIQPIKIYLVDDHKIFVRGVTSLLSHEKDLEVSGFSFDAATALRFLAGNTIDVLITDVQMPGYSGIELTKQVKELYPETKVIGLSMFDKAEIIKELINAGADGYLLKDIEKHELLTAIKQVQAGETYYSTAAARILFQSISEKEMLTPREKEIIKLIVQEHTNTMIAEKLFISEHTVESHRKNIFRKTQSKSIVGLVKFAYENKIA